MKQALIIEIKRGEEIQRFRIRNIIPEGLNVPYGYIYVYDPENPGQNASMNFHSETDTIDLVPEEIEES
jgi:hypothetical protein